MQLYRALEHPHPEDPQHQPAPLLWVLSRLCEEFGGYPTRALWELEHDPHGMALRIVTMRGFARTLEAYQRKPEDVPDGPMKELIRECLFGPVEEQRAKMHAVAAANRAAEEQRRDVRDRTAQ